MQSSQSLPSAMDLPNPNPNPNPNPMASFSSFLHHHFSVIGSQLSTRIDGARRLLPRRRIPAFAALSHSSEGKHSFDLALAPDSVASTLAGTPVYTVSNSSNEFVLVSDPSNGMRSLGILCFRREDANTLLTQVQARQPVLGKGARVVPINLDQVYMLKVEGIAFRFLPDPIQIRNALELKASDTSRGFDGVPVFQSDLLVVKKKNKRYCPIYFQKEDIERELSRVSRGSGGSNIMVGSLEDVLKKMEMNDRNSGWEDLIFIPPGKSRAQHIDSVAA